MIKLCSLKAISADDVKLNIKIFFSEIKRTFLCIIICKFVIKLVLENLSCNFDAFCELVTVGSFNTTILNFIRFVLNVDRRIKDCKMFKNIHKIGPKNF
jgi:hypothetical protein